MRSRRATKIISQETVFQKFSKKIIHQNLEMPDKKCLDWYYLDSPVSVLIVPITKDGEFILINQLRFNLKESVNEFPAGISRESENGDVTVGTKRELFEETGYVAKEIISLGKYYVLPSETNRWVNVYIALDVFKKSEPVLDNLIEKYFEIKVVKCRLDDIESGKVKLKGLEHLFALQLAKKYIEENGLSVKN